MGAPLYPDTDDRMPAYIAPPAPTAAEPMKPLLPTDPSAMDIDDEEEEGFDLAR